MKYRHVLDRRTVLRGAGSIAIGLPFLDAMHARSVWAQAENVPMRAITFFFGLGVRPEHAAQGLTGPLSPLAAFATKVGFSRNLNLGTSSSAGNHDVGSEAVFRGVGNKGASIDQFVLDTLHGGTSPTAIKSLVAGTYCRNNGARENHSYRPNGGITEAPIRVPQALFDRVFGQFDPGAAPRPTPTPEPGKAAICAADKAQHLRRSILDTVRAQYKALSGDAGGLGAASRSLLADHMDRIRELELATFGAAMQTATGHVEQTLAPRAGCAKPARPGTFTGQNFDAIQRRLSDGDVPDTRPVPLAWADWDLLWRGMSEIYALAIICDRTRFGNLQFTSGGERLSVVGNYGWEGRNIIFNDPVTAHEYWHGWGSDTAQGGTHKSRDWVDKHTHLVMSRAALFMSKLDAVKEGNGKSILENMLFLMSTELGDGGDSHSLKDIFHLWSGAGGKLKVGAGVDFGEMDATKVYNTIAAAVVGKPMTSSAAPDATSRGLLLS